MLRITLGEIRSRVLFFFFHVLLPSLSSLRSESGVAETGRREKIVEGNIPLSPFRCYVSKTSNISRSSDSVQCRTISQPSSFVFTGAVNKSAHPPADATILFPSFLLGRRRCSLERRSLSLSLSLDLDGLGLPCFAFRRMRWTRAVRGGPSAIGRREESLTMLSRKILCRSARAHNGGQTRSC